MKISHVSGKERSAPAICAKLIQIKYHKSAEKQLLLIIIYP